MESIALADQDPFDAVGHDPDFSGWFDAVLSSAGVLLRAGAFVVLAAYTFTTNFRGPGMVSGLPGAPH